jgi:hypothetical protein
MRSSGARLLPIRGGDATTARHRARGPRRVGSAENNGRRSAPHRPTPPASRLVRFSASSGRVGHWWRVGHRATYSFALDCRRVPHRPTITVGRPSQQRDGSEHAGHWPPGRRLRFGLWSVRLRLNPFTNQIAFVCIRPSPYRCVGLVIRPLGCRLPGSPRHPLDSLRSKALQDSKHSRTDGDSPAGRATRVPDLLPSRLGGGRIRRLRPGRANARCMREAWSGATCAEGSRRLASSSGTAVRGRARVSWPRRMSIPEHQPRAARGSADPGTADTHATPGPRHAARTKGVSMNIGSFPSFDTATLFALASFRCPCPARERARFGTRSCEHPPAPRPSVWARSSIEGICGRTSTSAGRRRTFCRLPGAAGANGTLVVRDEFAQSRTRDPRRPDDTRVGRTSSR